RSESKEKRQIADSFEDEVVQAARLDRGDGETLSKAWEHAQAKADQRYRLLFGKVAYDRESRRIEGER
ncbi:MAG TPA: hypothetical protein VFG14_08410, partial [Chthoniobacteraceae bacterium]|nr:hypothetical protein [Chthoniobacteraceae bacterium]